MGKTTGEFEESDFEKSVIEGRDFIKMRNKTKRHKDAEKEEGQERPYSVERRRPSRVGWFSTE